MVHNDDLGHEVLSVGSGLSLGIGSDVSSLDVLNRQVLNVESNIVTWNGLADGLVMHLDRLANGGSSHGSKADEHIGLDDTSLDSSDGHSSDTRDLVHILEGKSHWLQDG